MPKTVIIDENSGFCFGVINAIQTAEEYLRQHSSLFCLGDIVHNNEEVRRLSELGLHVIAHEDFQSLHDTTVMIRAHGEPPEVYRTAAKNRVRLIDATCPVVLRLQKRIADEYHSTPTSDKQILIYGKKGHAEVVGLLGQTDNTGIVISAAEDIGRIDFNRPAKLYSQTTQSVEKYYELIGQIKECYRMAGHPEYFEYADTICRKVASRAKQIAEFAARFDTILFVSGEKSSNGMYLFDICKQYNSRSFFMTSAEQIYHLDLSKSESVGICGATSTPMWLMREIAAICAKICDSPDQRTVSGHSS